MSMQNTQNIECPSCHKPVAIEVYQSLSPKRQTHAIQAILDNSFQKGKCSCGQEVRIEPEFIYMDLENKLCISAQPSKNLASYKKFADQAKQSFKMALATTGMGDGVLMRVTFGWPALREKILAHTENISDVDVEMMKLALIRESGEATDPTTSLRFVELTESDLIFTRYQNDAPFDEKESFEYSRSVLENIIESPQNWAPLRETMDQGLFVDLNRLFYED